MAKAQKFHKTKFPGVFYRELLAVDPRTGKRDRSYYISVMDELGTARWVQVGYGSAGMTAQAAARKKAETPVLEAAPEAQPATFGQAVEAYAAYARANRKHIDPPLEQYTFHCKKHLHTTLIDKFPPEKAEALKHRLEKRGLSAQSVAHALNFLRRVVNYAIATKRAKTNPFQVLPGGIFQMPKVQNCRERYLTPAECHALLDQLAKRSPQTYHMALVSLHTGMRATEIFQMRREDIDPAAGCIYVNAKGGRRETVPAPGHIIQMLLSIPQHPHSPYIFPMPDGSLRRKTPVTFRTIVDELGMQAPMGSPQHISFHTLRHTFASLLAQSGKVDIHELMKLMRHRSLDMTMRYAHLIPTVTASKVNFVGEALSSAPARFGSR